MIVTRIDQAPKAKRGHPFGMSPGLKRGHNYGPRLETFPVERVLWRRADRPHVYGPLEAPHFDVPDLSCLTCGRSVPNVYQHAPGEEFRDLAHPVKAYREVAS